MSQAAQTAVPLEAAHNLLSVALLSSFVAHHSPLPALYPWASQAGHPPEYLSASELLKPSCSGSSAVSLLLTGGEGECAPLPSHSLPFLALHPNPF